MDQSHFDNLFDYARVRNLVDRKGTSAPKLPDSPDQRLSFFLEYFQDFCKKSKDPLFGLNYGTFLNLRALHVVYDISVTVSSIRQLALIWKNYAKVSFPLIRVKELEEVNSYQLIFPRSFDAPMYQHIMDAVLVFSYRELKIITGINAISVGLPYASLTRYIPFFDCPITTEDNYAITFHKAADAIVTNQKDRTRIESLLPAFLYYLDSLHPQSSSFSHQVKLMTLHLCEPDCPTVDQVAAQFCMTPRTLQRKLKQENMSFRKITNGLKQELYHYLNQGKSLKTIEMSSLLGYSSSSAFLHALKSWNLQATPKVRTT